MLTIIETENAPMPVGPYSQGVCANGFVFVSGQLPLCPETGEIVQGGIEEQTHQVMKNLSAILQAGGTETAKVVKVTVFLADLEDFDRFNRIYEQYLGSVRPARSTIQAARLPKGALLELDVIAAI